jgi:hypothetical protein
VVGEILASLDNKRIYFKPKHFLDNDEFRIYLQTMNTIPNIQFDKKTRKGYYCSVPKFLEIEYSIKDDGWDLIRDGSLRGIASDLYRNSSTKNYRNFFDVSVLKKDLLDFQREDVNFFIQKNRTANFSDMGLGKTVESIAAFSYLYNRNFIDKIFIFLLGSLSYNWKREILSFSNQFVEEDIIICDNTNKYNLLKERKKIYIIPYNLLGDVFCSACDKMNPPVKIPKEITYVNMNKRIINRLEKEEDAEFVKSCFERDKDKKVWVRNTKDILKKYPRLKEILLSINFNRVRDSKKSCQCSEDKLLALKEMIGSETNMMAVCDESQSMMNTKSVTFKILNNYKQFFEFRHIMSATPNINGFEDVWTQMSFLDESIIGMPYRNFCRFIAKEMGRTFRSKDGSNKEQYVAGMITEYNADNIKIIDDKMKSWVLRKFKRDVPWFKINKYVDTLFFDLTYDHRILYQTFCNYQFDILREDGDVVYALDIMNTFPYIAQVIDFPPMLLKKVQDPKVLKLISDFDYTKSAKFLALEEMVNEHMSKGEKIIISDWRPDVMNYLSEKFSKHRNVIIDGEQKSSGGKDRNSVRQDIIDDFNNSDSDLKILFLSSMIGAGFNLNKACRNLIFYNLGFDAENFVQTQDRIYRINNLWDVNIKVMVYDRTIDYKRYKVNMNREKINDSIFGNKVLTVEEYRKIFEGDF